MMLRFFAVTLLLLIFDKGGIAENDLEFLAEREIPENGTFITYKHKIGILEKLSGNSPGSRNAGDVYIGTTEGVYLKYFGTHDIEKIEGIDEPVAAIDIDINNGAYVTTSNGTLYYIDKNGNNTGLQNYIPDRILSIGILKKQSSGRRRAGDMYIGTTKGVYLKYVGTRTIKKIQGINEPVTAINIDFNGAAYATTLNGTLYYIDTNGDNKQGELLYIPSNIISIAVVEEDTLLKRAGDVYFGTTTGVYLKHVGTPWFIEIEGINEAVIAINIDFNGGVFVTTSTGKLYYIDIYTGDSQRVQSNIPLTILSVRCIRKPSGSLNPGDLYIPTTKGVYLKYVGTDTIKKINGINEPVIEIDIDFNGTAYLITSIGKVYYIDPSGENYEAVEIL